MKRVIIILSFFLFSATYVFSQVNTERELVQKMKAEGYSVSTIQYADLYAGSSARYWKTFYSGSKYIIVAFPEESGVNDIDVYLYDDDGSLLTQDTDASPFAVLEYAPYTTRNMKVVIKNYGSNSQSYDYRCKFIIFYK